MVRSWLSAAFWSLSAIGGIYAVFIGLLTNATVQRHALYAHRFETTWLHDVNKPESFGFAEKQVSPFNITTPDLETLFAWHVLPPSLYAKSRSQIIGGISSIAKQQFEDSVAFQLLRQPEARLLIYFHGNAGHVAQNWRAHAYRYLSAGDGDRIHILAVDYRGFGLSSGTPSEEGLITDGIAVVNWALNVAGIPPERIVICGHSLGTAIAIAVAERFVTAQPAIQFSGVVLISGFSDIPNLLKTYAIGGIFPILSPLKPYPRLQRLISSYIVDTWDSAKRLTSLATQSTKLRLYLVHARNDFDIGWKHTNLLYSAAISGASDTKLDAVDDLGEWSEEGAWMKTCSFGDTVTIKRWIMQHGGHNQIIAYAPVSLVVHEAFTTS